MENDRATVIFGGSDTILAATADKSGRGGDDVLLKQGKLAVVTREKDAVVKTDQGSILIPASSVVIIEQKPNNTVRVTNFKGGATIMQSGTKTFTCNSGERVTVADSSVDDEDLIPIDGGDVVVNAKVAFNDAAGAPKKARISKFDGQKVWDKEMMLGCIQISDQFKRTAKKNGQDPKKTSNSSPLLPIALNQPTTGSGLKTLRTEVFNAKFLSSAKTQMISSNTFRLNKGEICLETIKPLLVLVGKQRITIGANTVVLIDKQDKALLVRNVYDRKPHSVRVSSNKLSLDIPVGQESVLSDKTSKESSLPDDAIGRRRTRVAIVADGSKLTTSEISIPSILASDSIYAAMRRSAKTEDQILLNKTLNTAVVLNYVTASHGQFHENKD